jgi:DNA helicase II / ATP-dependent DNA helicase PcrA
MDFNSSDSGNSRQARLQNILLGLNPVQRKAATKGDGPIVVFAGAGSGKTRIITHRIAWLIEQGTPPWEIMAVTFTNKAAGEMRTRVDDLTPFAKRTLIATFHSACARWLREFAGELGYTSDFTIYDEQDSLAAIKMVIKGLNIKLDEETTPSEIRQAIGRVKTLALLPSDPKLKNEYTDMLPDVGHSIYKRYQELLAACNAMDFADLIMNVLLLLRRNQMVKGLLSKRYRYILVDEYQDTNQTQFELISHLVSHYGNLFVVGDDDQSIYSWRGAMPSNIINFQTMFHGAEKVTMEQNYRCTGNIVNAANAMIAKNQTRVKKNLFTHNPDGALITFRFETDSDMEAWWVVDHLKQSGFSLKQSAIFYRTNAQSRVLEEALRRENVPYQIFGTVRFYDRMEIKDLLAYLRLTINPNDDVSLKRVINVPTRGIGAKAINVLESEASRRGQPLLLTLREMVDEHYPRLGAKLAAFLEIFDLLRKRLAEAPLNRFLEIVLDTTDYLRFVSHRFPDVAQDKTENVHELGSALSEFSSRNNQATLTDWLQSISLSSAETEVDQSVSLMTLHMAKGLEYANVYVLGVEEGLLPHNNSMGDLDSLEEERRLFYVGMTRAREHLTLLSVYRRRTFNSWAQNQPSRFLKDIPSQYFRPAGEVEDFILKPIDATGDEGHDGVKYDYTDSEASDFTISSGARVTHPTYGKGCVDRLDNDMGMIKAVVDFDEFGRRRVLAKHLVPLG